MCCVAKVPLVIPGMLCCFFRNDHDIYNEISTSSAYGSPHAVGPLLLSHIVGNVSPYSSNGRSEIRVPRELFLLAAGADFGSQKESALRVFSPQ